MARNQKLQVDIEANDRASGTIDRVADKADALDKTGVDVEVEADDKASATLDDIAAKLEDLGIPAGKLTPLLGKAGAAGAVVAIGAGLIAASQHAANVAFEAQNIATLTGDSVEEASRLNAVWKQSGADSKDLQDVLLQMNGVLATNADIAKTLGINLNDGATVGQRFEQVAAALDAIPDAAKRSQIASQVFGEEGVRQYNNMRNAVGDLSDALADVPAGSVISEEDVEKAREMQEQMREVTAELQAFATSIGTVVLPAIGGLVGGINDLFDASEGVGQSIRGWFDGGEAQRNRDYAASIDAAEAAARKFDTTLLDGVTSADEARRIAEEYTSTLKGEEDQLHATNAIVVEWAKANEAATEAQAAAEEAALQHTEAQRDQARAASNTATVLSRNSSELERLRGHAERAAAFVEGLGTEWDQLKGKLSDESAHLAAMSAFDRLGMNAQAAIDAGSEATAEQKQALIDLKLEVGNYLVEVGKVPPSVATRLVANMDTAGIANIHALIASWTTPHTIPLVPRVINTGGGSSVYIDENGNVRSRHTGGRVDPGTPVQPLSGEVFVPDVAGRVVSREDVQRSSSVPLVEERHLHLHMGGQLDQRAVADLHGMLEDWKRGLL